MKKYGVNELRKMYLEFFESKGHLAMKSFSLVPHNDNSLLLINAGMAPLKPYFTGQEIPPRKRVTTCQKCIRTGDIENVGKTARHGTFFEMLGNFSFGDYFKKEAIAWSWEFLTEVVGLDADRLYPSVYLEDDEAFAIWRDDIGIAPERIFKFGKEDNFWEHGAGPCGPCSEIYYDRGEKYGCGSPTCTVGCDCDRYMEVWNNVFTQFDNDGHNNYTLLEQKNIDTGMGLERLAVVVQDVDSIFDVDTIRSLRDKVCEMAGKTYKEKEEDDVSIRLITDHIRSATFMISDGIMPTNEGRGYVLRRIIRRAARHGRLLGIRDEFLAKLSKTVIEGSRDGYPELEEKKEFIFNVLTQEENKFNKTIDQGLGILAELEEDLKKSGQSRLSGEEAFKLYDTYGFPLDLTREILMEKGYGVDEEGFGACMEEQRVKARSARKETNYMGADVTVYESIDPSVTTVFVGYDHRTYDSKITVMTTETELTEALTDGQTGTIFVEETPFYATGGGQHADTGVIRCADGEFVVEDTVKLLGDKVGHIGRVTKGMFKVGDVVTLSINEEQRDDTMKNHSATHLLQKALRTVLGSHVEQAGSYNDRERLRFDFSHFQAMTPEEISKVEEIVNEQIAAELPVKTQIMTVDEAKKTGAMALFGEKYGEKVRVISMGDFSKEFCAGTHVPNTGVIRSFKIISETGVAAGVRRIEAITGNNVTKYYQDVEKTLLEAARAMKAEPHKLTDRIHALLDEVKALSSENEKLKDQIAKSEVADVMDQVVEAGAFKVLPVSVKDVDMNALRTLSDDLKQKIGSGVVVLASDVGGKVNLIVTATEDAVKAGAHAGNIIKQAAVLVGGGGGGRPNMAQAGGKNPAGIADALAKAVELAKEQIA
ncbi:MAG: alanine--tRNA ligase [Eubacteriales bacterium]|nr:alanine--tRNA ligase [Eubacteriales bacterium]